MPGNLSSALSDLINRMLQPLPMKRFTLEEVWSHPWVSGLSSPYDEYQIPLYVTHFQ
jgi:serine/threonine protein kinase